MGSDLLKPYPARHQTTPAVIERPRPVLKGLRPLATNGIAETAVVERPRPAPKGLKQWAVNGLYSFGASKDPPCSKGIEINQYQKYEG